MTDGGARPAQPERVRRPALRAPISEQAQEPPRTPLISRPTAVERAQGVEAITTLHELKLLRGKATAVEPNVIALALAWRRGDRALNNLNHQERNVLFGVQASAKTHRDWVVDAASRRLDRLAAYRRHCALPESERRGAFDVSTCLQEMWINLTAPWGWQLNLVDRRR